MPPERTNAVLITCSPVTPYLLARFHVVVDVEDVRVPVLLAGVLLRMDCPLHTAKFQNLDNRNVETDDNDEDQSESTGL